MSFWKGELSTILMALFLDEMQDSDSERKQERIQTGREEEKKENDMIIFQEMITIPNQEEIDELVGGRSTCRFVIPRCKQQHGLENGKSKQHQTSPRYLLLACSGTIHVYKK